LSGAVLTVQQSTTAPTGFRNSQSVTVTTSTTANDSGGISQIIEANNAFDLAWGTSSGSTVTASFWVRSSVTGTYNIWFRYFGSSATNNYLTTYTISAANTWEQKTITIPAPPTAAGAFTAALNTSYLEVRFIINSSGNTTVTTANTWSTSTAVKTTGAVDLASNSGATFFVTGVQLEKGFTATNFDVLPYGTELQLCQRYCAVYSAATAGDGFFRYGLAEIDDTINANVVFPYPVPMRARPTLTTTGTASNYAVYSNSTITACSSVPFLQGATSTTTCCVGFRVASGLTRGYAAAGMSNGNNTSFLIFSAEL
jgi:hypothetical protein